MRSVAVLVALLCHTGCLMNYVASPAAFEKAKAASDKDHRVVVGAKRAGKLVFVKARKLRLLEIYDENTQEAAATNTLMTVGTATILAGFPLIAGGMAVLFQDDPNIPCSKGSLCSDRIASVPLIAIGAAAAALGVFLVGYGAARPLEESRGKLDRDEATGTLRAP